MLTRTQEYKPSHGKWICGRCHVPLEQLPVQAAYLQGAFDVTLPRCPKCGMTLVPGDLADGKMAEVEGLLEDK